MGNENRQSATVSDHALSFLPKSWLEAQINADRDLKLARQKMESFKAPFSDLASSFDREWKKFTKTSLQLGNFEHSENLLLKLRTTAISAQVENFPAKIFTSSGINWNPDAHPHGNEVAFWKPPPSKLEPSSVRKAFSTSLDEQSRKDVDHKSSKRELECLLDWKQMKVAIQEWQNRGRPRKTYPVDEWEPLRRLRVSLIELETAAAASRTPKEFWANLKKIEYLENTKKIMKIPMLNTKSAKGHSGDDNIAPLDVLELLESLVRHSQPLLDQLGVKKGFSDKVCGALQTWKRHNAVTAVSEENNIVSMLSKEAGRAANELDFRIASVLNSTGNRYKGDVMGEHALTKEVRPCCKRNIAIVTTASLPWMTGTAINPLLRAAYLAKNGKQDVTLLVPWLSKTDQEHVYPNNMTFNSPQDQENYIRQWLSSRISFQPDFKLVFYSAKFSEGKRSILAVDDISQFVPDREADIAILEEPEHLTWYHHGVRWTRKFQHVVGVVHTNYLEYVKREKNGPFQAFLLKYVNNWVTNIYCHKVIRLSAATQKLPRSVICNVHGVSPKFLDIGQSVAAERDTGNPMFLNKPYFLGKMIWGKGYRELLDLWKKHKEDLQGLELDVFGNGEDSAAVKAEAAKYGLRLNFNNGRDHADTLLHCYKVFINPSVSDVVCTTTAEALAMGKIVVCADHPSNDFFKCFPNCFMYKTSEEFVEKVRQAMNSEPLPLSADEQHQLSWEAATERFLECADLDKLPPKGSKMGYTPRRSLPTSTRVPFPRIGDFVDSGMFLAHYCLTGIEVARLASGAVPRSMHMDKDQRRELGMALATMEDDIYYSW